MIEGWTLALRLNADPGRVVVRPFQLAWQASGPNPTRMQKLVDEILSLDIRTVREELGRRSGRLRGPALADRGCI